MNNKSQLGFIHTFIPSDSSRKDDDSLNLLLLHGTGGDENDLISIARMLDIANASILSPRGKVLENGMPRFFRRLAEGVFDIEDLRFRTNELADFVQRASKTYTFDLNRTLAIGYSNGANIAASMLLLRPEILSGAILFRPMIPLVPDTLPNLSSKHILISAGLHDPIVPRYQTEDLFDLLKKAEAKVSIQWQNSGHELTQRDIKAAKDWVMTSSLS
ncbi:MAG TPA: alpha/beta hydrolase [Nitrososphaeraceae archaeon]|nr:alpha/beta hydrolase [Nitrososphaeraceae archaeon]